MKHVCMVMTDEEVENILGIQFINDIANIGLPELHYDPECQMELHRIHQFVNWGRHPWI